MKMKTNSFLALLAGLTLAIAVAIGAGCANQNRVTYQTLSGVYTATSGALDVYLDLVTHGQVKTNGVPGVLRAWDGFRVVWGQAVALASFNTNAPATGMVLTASSNVVSTINLARTQP